MSDHSARFALPHILPGQAQKEVWHNEALALIDAALHASAETRGDEVPPAEPAPGQSWIVGAAPVGAWSGQADRLASWSEGGWRFVAPVEGMQVWVAAEGRHARWNGSAWVDGELVGASLVIAGDAVVGARQGAVADPIGGTTVDAEARAAIAQLLAAMRGHGLIGP